MITNVIYIIVALILIFLIYISIKAISRGIEAKKKINRNKKSNKNYNNLLEKENINIGEEILQIKKLHDEGVLTKDEFKKAKEKILSS